MATVPTTVYDRAKLAGGAVLGGDLDAVTASIFAPMELSPQELKSIRDRLTGEGKHADNPLIKTMLDIATNPIVLIGAFLALGPWGKVMNIKDLHALMNEGKGRMDEVSGLMRGLTSPITGLRDLWHTGWFDKVLDIMRRASVFMNEYMPRLDTLKKSAEVKLGRKITEREWAMVHAYNEKWHLAKNPISHDWTVKFPDLAQKAIAPRLEAAMAPELRTLAQQIDEQIWKATREYYPKVTHHRSTVTGLMEEKGIKMVEEGYVHRVMPRFASIDTLKGMQGLVRTGYEKMLRAASATPGMVKSRVFAGSLPDLEKMKLIEDLLDPDQVKILRNIPKEQAARVQRGIYEMAGTFRDIRLAPEKVVQLYEVEGGPLKVVGGKEELFQQLGPTAGKFIGTMPKEEHIEQLVKNFAKVLTAQFGIPEEKAMIAVRLVQDAERSGIPERVQEVANVLGHRLGSPPQYSIDPRVSIPKYIRSLGPLWAWFGEVGEGVKPLGLQLDDIFAEGKVQTWQKNMYTDHIRPGLRGLLTPKEYFRRLWFAGETQKAKEWLSSDSPIVKGIPSQVKDWLNRQLTAGALSEQTIGGRLSSLLYISTLGGNLSPVSKNLFQNWITTANFVGVPNMMRGTQRVAGGLGQLSKRLAQGESMETAFPAVFPEYWNVLGHEHILSGVTSGDTAKETQALGNAMQGVWGKTKTVLMGPFSGSEKFNRLLAFYSSHAAATRAGLPAEAAGQISRQLTMMTQFGGGAIGIPSAIRETPVPLRQFAHFPLKMLEWLYGSMRMGPEGHFSTGIIGRTAVGSAAMYEIFKNLVGVDISGALAFSAVPQPTFENAPFYPLPIVPPAVSVAGDIAKALGTGEWEGVAGRTAAMLTPGGLAARRAYRTWAPRFVDYQHRQPDGTYPIYNKDKYLIRNESPASLVLRGLGIQTTSQQEELALTQYFLKQRDKIRQFRREYIAATLDNNIDRAQKIQDQFAKAYPQLGKIQVKERDLKYAMGQRTVSRIQRVLKGMPSDYRPIFEQVAGLSMASDFADTINTGLE